MNFRQIREACGLTRGQVKLIYGIPKRTVENWEMGNNNSKEYIVKNIAERIALDYYLNAVEKAYDLEKNPELKKVFTDLDEILNHLYDGEDK